MEVPGSTPVIETCSQALYKDVTQDSDAKSFLSAGPLLVQREEGVGHAEEIRVRVLAELRLLQALLPLLLSEAKRCGGRGPS